MSAVGTHWGKLAITLLSLLLGGCPERAHSVSDLGSGPASASSSPRHAASTDTAGGIPESNATGSAVPRAALTGLSPASPWSSREACQRLLAGRSSLSESPPAGSARAAARDAATAKGARIGTWNIRWYPDGRPGKKAATPGTDIVWLACAIAVLDVDVLAVQEMKTLPRAAARTSELLAELGRITGARWQAAFDDCPQQATQHVGLLWNEARATVSQPHTEPALNPHGSPCKDSLRPAFVADVRFADGSAVRIASVHFKSGTERRSLELRTKSFAAMEGVLEATRQRGPAPQMIFAGDFNTMGCPGCSPKISAEMELADVRNRIAPFGLRLLPTEPGCSEYYRDRGQLLDGFVVTQGVADRARLPARSEGLCGELACGHAPRVGQAAAVRRLSDHCPVVLELGSE